MMRLILAAALFACASMTINTASAQQSDLPPLPAPIQNLVNEGAQIRYLGNDLGFDAWITIKNGQEQYFYVKPDGKSFVLGLLFNEEGDLVTLNQVQRLRENGEELLDELASDLGDQRVGVNSARPNTPSERLFSQIQNSNWVPLGQAGAPAIYSFIDPQCPHCHSFIEDLRVAGVLERGQMQLRMIPVGFRDETRAQAAFLIAAPNAERRWFEHMDGSEEALPAKSDINQLGVQKNIDIMREWEIDVTPMSIYRAKDGTVKIVRGKPKDLSALIRDLPPGS